MKKQQGFTLIELVVVIIILGILAVTAAPKFINLQSDARASTLEGVKGALQGANALVYSKAAIQGKESKPTAEVIIDDKGDTDADNDIKVNAVYGYVNNASADLVEVLDIDTTSTSPEWVIVDSPNVTTEIEDAIIIHPGDKTPSATVKCWVEYKHPAAKGAAPTYKVEDSGC
ncbi:prepilin-type N-terminal cleavage/methylation domain-containing protein [Shewanella algidipiscicola]|uniref:MSHA pilin protein MshA n=1 Tax=Shewanella algidipiscicola TaxID=614070 RepID=A0ABQ4P7X2_9GAMM|nr:prepilin-type N-terminal cleavage/methylation domain-containing protein [Shewanella algidipiscicola]GIU43642.1 MSHA pilin protein MshA [Shewanella algidipiscicola]